MLIFAIDDEPKMLRLLHRAIAEAEPDAEIMDFEDDELLSDVITGQGKRPDVVFSDIELQGCSGLELAVRIKRLVPQTKIIFVTGYREYMEAAFDVQAFHYLVKPIDREKFVQVLEKACREAEFLHQQGEDYVLLKARGQGGDMESRKVFLRDIRFVESNNKNVIFHTEGGSFPAQGTMEDFEERLGAGFYRCHRCYLVNLACITAYSQREIKVTGGETVMLAHKKYGAFVKAYLRYAKGGGLINV